MPTSLHMTNTVFIDRAIIVQVKYFLKVTRKYFFDTHKYFFAALPDQRHTGRVVGDGVRVLLDAAGRLQAALPRGDRHRGGTDPHSGREPRRPRYLIECRLTFSECMACK